MKKCISIFVALILVFRGQAQEIFKPVITTGIEHQPEQVVVNSTENFSASKLQVALNFPIYQQFSIDDDMQLNLYGIKPQLDVSTFQLTAWNSEHTLYRSGFTSYGIFVRGANAYVANLSFFWLGDSQIVSRASPLLSGNFIYRKKTSESLSFMLGAAYSFNFGGGIPFPLLGLQIGNLNTHRFQMLLPLILSFQSPQVKSLQYEFNLRPNGGIRFYQDDGQFGDELFLRFKAIKLGGSLGYLFKKKLKISLDANILVRRNVSLTEPNQTGLFDDALVSWAIENGGMIGLTFEYRFSAGVETFTFFDVLSGN